VLKLKLEPKHTGEKSVETMLDSINETADMSDVEEIENGVSVDIG
jgi:hypothetical protein